VYRLSPESVKTEIKREGHSANRGNRDQGENEENKSSERSLNARGGGSRKFNSEGKRQNIQDSSKRLETG